LKGGGQGQLRQNHYQIGGGAMQVAIVRTTVDRATGEQISEKIIGYEEVDEDAFYRPIVEVFGKRVLEAFQNNKQEGGLSESEDGQILKGTGENSLS